MCPLCIRENTAGTTHRGTSKCAPCESGKNPLFKGVKDERSFTV